MAAVGTPGSPTSTGTTNGISWPWPPDTGPPASPPGCCATPPKPPSPVSVRSWRRRHNDLEVSVERATERAFPPTLGSVGVELVEELGAAVGFVGFADAGGGGPEAVQRAQEPAVRGVRRPDV